MKQRPIPRFGAPKRRRVALPIAGLGPRVATQPLAALREIASAHGATPAQVALAWVLHHPNTVAIPGARTLEQLEENAAAADLVLSDAEFAGLSPEAEPLAASPRS